jgi:hypothetical protein
MLLEGLYIFFYNNKKNSEYQTCHDRKMLKSLYINLKLNYIIVNLIDKVVLADLMTIQSVIKKALRIKLIEKKPFNLTSCLV